MRPIKTQSSGITKRYTFRSNDGHLVRAAYVQRPEKDIICLSTQIGCAGNCKFCSAYDKPIIRSLREGEMADMVLEISRQVGILYTKCPLLVSFMGTGEPLANLDNVLGAMKYFKPEVKVAISVSGDSIHQVERISPYTKVQFTLVAANQHIRDFLQPNVDPLSDLRYAVEHYTGPKELNTPLIDGYNDDPVAIRQIADFVKASGNPPIKLNKYHPMNGFKDSMKFEECLEALKNFGCQAEYYETDGADVYAACGQFELG